MKPQSIESGFDVDWENLIIIMDETPPVTQEFVDHFNSLRRNPTFCLMTGYPQLR